MEELIKKYNISETFFERYFKENAESRFGIELSKFMWYKIGKFINPMKKTATLEEFTKEEIINFYEKQELNIPFLEFNVTTKCTLQCADCCALIPLFNQKEHIDLKFENFKNQFDKITSAANIRHLIFLGGEPLMNPELPDMIDYAAKCKEVSIIRITTNGTIMPSKRLIEAINNNPNKIYFYLSNYSLNQALESILKYEELKNLLHKNNIKFQMIDSWNWLKEEGMSETESTEEETINKIKNCYRIKCSQILNGKFDVCSKALGARELGLLNDNSFIDIMASSNLKQDLIDFYKKDIIDACKYCIISNEPVQPALQG